MNKVHPCIETPQALDGRHWDKKYIQLFGHFLKNHGTTLESVMKA
jgi:hypothetical protein